MRGIGVGMLPWGIIGGLLLAYHVAETRREAAEERLRRARARLGAVISIARRIRGERDEARAQRDEGVEYVSRIEDHGLRILRIEDHDHLRAERDRAAVVTAELVQMRTALELIADGCEAPQQLAVEALGGAEEATCEAN
ncbi:hypothetical protein [Sorangium sp. So ce1024]|uniref:hypothetical protein n=1 Tax=Sorangium sp. So ce1024 TaxID=3133327 RepID=UPI003F0CBC58